MHIFNFKLFLKYTQIRVTIIFREPANFFRICCTMPMAVVLSVSKDLVSAQLRCSLTINDLSRNRSGFVAFV